MQYKSYIYSSTIGLILLTFFQFFIFSTSNTELNVYFLDVGQGDSALMTYPSGEHVLIDTGKDSSIFRELDKVLPWYDKTIDYVLLTHGDIDHVGAMIDLLDRYKVKKVFVSEFFGQIDIEKEIISRIEKESAEIEVLKAGDVITFGTNISNNFKIINPNSNCFVIYKNENDCSLVGVLSYGKTSFLFTGDVSKDIESNLIQDISQNISVLKVAHHGSKYSSDKNFIFSIHPEYSIISVGENKYGHPSPEVIDTLLGASSSIWITKEVATIVATSDGSSVKVRKLFDQSSFLQSSICTILLYGFEASC